MQQFATELISNQGTNWHDKRNIVGIGAILILGSAWLAWLRFEECFVSVGK